MDEITARKIFEKAKIEVYCFSTSFPNNKYPDSLKGKTRYIEWESYYDKITIDDDVTAEEMEALAWWMKNKKKEMQE